jgi:hypothetical protein
METKTCTQTFFLSLKFKKHILEGYITKQFYNAIEVNYQYNHRISNTNSFED